MSGDEAKSPDDPESLLGLISNTEPPGARQDRPPAVFGIVSLFAPFVGYGIGMWLVPRLAIMERHDGSGAAWGGPFMLLFFVVGVALLGCLVGVILALWALVRNERWPLFGCFGVAINGGAILMIVKLFFRY
jgi:hypothetical protein